MKRSKSIYYFIILFSLGIFITQCTSRESKIREQLQIEVDEINIMRSTSVNNFMRFDSCVLLPNNNIDYFYSLTDTITPAKIYFQNLEREVKDSFRKEPGMATVRSFEVTAKYIYNDIKGNHLYSFEITPTDYQ